MRTRPFVVATFAGLVFIPQGGTAFSTEPAQATCAGLPTTIVGTDGDDTLIGTAGDDVIAGALGDDVVRGLGGNDVLCGDRGTDDLDGGAGDDRVYGGRNGLQQPYPDNPPDNVGDDLVGGPGNDLLDPGWDVTTDAEGGFIPDEISYADSPAAVRVDLPAARATGDGDDTLVLEGRVQVVGTAYDDVLVSGDESDDLFGGTGDDVLVGGKGRDYLQADEDDYPTPDAEAYDDRVFGGPGGDGIYLGNGDDEARGGSGDDTISHGSGMADLRAGSGDDDLETRMRFADGSVVDGGPGVDQTYVWSVDVGDRRRVDVVGRIDLGSGRFTMRLGDRTRFSVLSGVERLRIPDGRWTVLGTAADETFFGGDLRRDAIVVRAGGGDDYVTGTPGDDELYGGAGRDKAVYVGAGDTVTGFEVVRH
jgi:Ca2+-binding RTX toxin-like protein